MATKWSWCIFQLPAMTGLRSTAITTCRFRYGVPASGHASVSSPSEGSLRSKCFQAGQVAPLDELERRAAAGAHVVDAVGEAELADGGGAVAAPDHRERGRSCDRLRDGAGAGRERGRLGPPP